MKKLIVNLSSPRKRGSRNTRKTWIPAFAGKTNKVTLILILLLCMAGPAEAKLNIVTTTPDLADIARQIGRDLVEVKSIYQGDWNPHYLEPKPSYAVLLSKADLLVLIGLDLERGWLPVLLNQACNPKLRTGAAGYLDASQVIQAIEIPQGPIDRSEGDVHPDGNPHYWLNPHNGLGISALIAQRLAQLDPTNAPLYQQNQLDFSARLKSKMAGWKSRIGKFSGTKIIAHHSTYSYFALWSGLVVAGYLEPKPGIPPNPGHLAKLATVIDQESIKLIVVASHDSSKPARTLADRTGATYLILPASVGGDIKNYFELFDVIIQKIGEKL